MKLITETIEDINLICEDLEESGKKSYYIEGVFLQGDIKNRNGRLYPSAVLSKEVDKYTESFIDKGRALGELGHPEGPTINLDRVSHKIVSLKKEGTNFIGKAKLLETPMGKIASNLLNEGVKLGVSSRGMGSLELKNGVNYVKDDFMLATAADIVADPSAHDAFVEGLMEGKEWVGESGVLREVQIEQIKRSIDTASRVELEERKIKAFENFLRGL